MVQKTFWSQRGLRIEKNKIVLPSKHKEAVLHYHIVFIVAFSVVNTSNRTFATNNRARGKLAETVLETKGDKFQANISQMI